MISGSLPGEPSPDIFPSTIINPVTDKFPGDWPIKVQEMA
jgi:hypothetical protein